MAITRYRLGMKQSYPDAQTVRPYKRMSCFFVNNHIPIVFTLT